MYGGAMEGVLWLTHLAAKRGIRAYISLYVVSADGARYPTENYKPLSESSAFQAVRRNLRTDRALNPRNRPTTENRKRNPFEGGPDANPKDRSALPMGH